MSVPRYRGHDAGRALASAIVASGAEHGLTVTIADARCVPWASATFTGARHELRLAIEGDAAAIEEWKRILPEYAFALGHHLVADLAVRDGEVIEALTVADC